MGGLTSLLLLLCVGVTVSTVLDLQKRIEGGHDCRPSERKYHVKILDVNENFICGGSLLSDNWILTAAHCKKSGMKVEDKEGPVDITEAHVYSDELKEPHDIMLLKPSSPIESQYVNLPDCGSQPPPKLGETVRVAGHGPIIAGSNTPAVNLQCADFTVASCTEDIPYHPDKKRSIFCGKTPGVRTCGGDSGGGVEYKGKIYGVHQGSAPDKCDRISGFLNVCRYRAWIKEKTGI